MLFAKNIGEYLSIDETAFSNGDLYTILTNKKAKEKKGALTVVGNYGIKIPTEKQNFSYRTKNWRYIKYRNGQEELYNHEIDGYETNNVASESKYLDIKKKLINEVNAIINK